MHAHWLSSGQCDSTGSLTGHCGKGCSPYTNNKIHEENYFSCLLTYLHKDVINWKCGSHFSMMGRWVWVWMSACIQDLDCFWGPRMSGPRLFLTWLTHYVFIKPGTTLFLDFSLPEYGKPSIVQDTTRWLFHYWRPNPTKVEGVEKKYKHQYLTWSCISQIWSDNSAPAIIQSI